MIVPSISFGNGTGRESGARPVRYIRSHGGLRGIAALMVVFYHLQFGAAHRLEIETATPLFARGYLMVDLFFILSGFVISLTSHVDRTRAFSQREARNFLIARFSRIYPLHLFTLCVLVVCTLVLASLRQLHHPTAFVLKPANGDVTSFIEELLLIQAWIPDAPRWNIPSWSISAEVFAYALFPTMLILRSKLPRLMILILISTPGVFYLLVIVKGWNLDIISGLAPLRCLSGFAIGVLLYDIRQSVTRWSDGVIAASQLTAGLGIVVVLATPSPDPIIIPFFALLVISTWQDRGPISHFLFNPILTVLGELSYSIYLNHVCVITVLFPVWYWLVGLSGINPSFGRGGYIGICLISIIAVSRWTYTNVEVKGRRVLKDFILRTISV